MMRTEALLLFKLLMFLLMTFQNSFGITFKKERIVRSPDAAQIRHWKLAFSDDLAPSALSQLLPNAVSCHWALNELCLRHVSCRELWALFRRNCAVDAQNQCQMANKNDCWQSFEGISWTGLGSCTCAGNNSDCHWIRLQTNYNKCIYELNHDKDWHAQLATAAQFASKRTTAATTLGESVRESIGIERWGDERQQHKWSEEDRKETIRDNGKDEKKKEGKLKTVGEREERERQRKKGMMDNGNQNQQNTNAIEKEKQREERKQEEDNERKKSEEGIEKERKEKEQEEDNERKKSEEEREKERKQEEDNERKKSEEEREKERKQEEDNERKKSEEERRKRIAKEEERKKKYEEERKKRWKEEQRKRERTDEEKERNLTRVGEKKRVGEKQTKEREHLDQKRVEEKQTKEREHSSNDKSSPSRNSSEVPKFKAQQISPTAESQRLVTQVEQPPNKLSKWTTTTSTTSTTPMPTANALELELEFVQKWTNATHSSRESELYHQINA